MRHRVQEGQCPWRHLQLPSHPQEENKPKLCRAWRADSGFPPHPFNELRWRKSPQPYSVPQAQCLGALLPAGLCLSRWQFTLASIWNARTSAAQEEPEGQQLGQRSLWIPAGRDRPEGKTPQDGSVHLMRMTPLRSPESAAKCGHQASGFLLPWNPGDPLP